MTAPERNTVWQGHFKTYVCRACQRYVECDDWPKDPVCSLCANRARVQEGDRALRLWLSDTGETDLNPALTESLVHLVLTLHDELRVKRA